MQIDDSFGGGAEHEREDRPAGTLTLDFDTFAWSALTDESAALGVSIDELVSFSVLYYVSDRDSGRIARALPRMARREEPAGGRADAWVRCSPPEPSGARAPRAAPLAASLAAR